MSIFTVAGLSSFYSQLDGRTDIDQLCDEIIGKHALSRSGCHYERTVDESKSFQQLLETVGSILLFQLVHQFRQSTAVVSPESHDIPPRLHSISPDKIPTLLRYLHDQYRSSHASTSGAQRAVLEILYLGSRLLHLESVQTRRSLPWFQYLSNAIDDPIIMPGDNPVATSLLFGIKGLLQRQPRQRCPPDMRDLRYCAGVSSGLISNPLHPLDLGKISQTISDLERRRGMSGDSTFNFDYFWSLCDISYIIVTASAEPYNVSDIEDYRGKLSSFVDEFHTKIANSTCNKLQYVYSLVEESLGTQGTEAAQPNFRSQISDLLRQRDHLATLSDRNMKRALDSFKSVHQGDQVYKIYSSNCPKGHVLNETQKQRFLRDYHRRGGRNLETSQNSAQVFAKTADPYPCPICSEGTDPSQNPGSITSLTEIAQFTELSKIVQVAREGRSAAVIDMSRYYQTADHYLKVTFPIARKPSAADAQVPTDPQNNGRQNGSSLDTDNTSKRKGPASHSSDSSGRDSLGRRLKNPVSSPNGSSGSVSAIPRWKSVLGLKKSAQDTKKQMIDLSNLNTTSILVSTHTASNRVFFVGKSSISIYSYANLVPEQRGTIQLDSELPSTPTSISISPSMNFLAIGINFMKGRSQIQVWSLDDDGDKPDKVWQQALEGPTSSLAVHPEENFVFIITNNRTLDIFKLVDNSRVHKFDVPLHTGIPDKVSIVGGDILLLTCSPDLPRGQMKIFTLSFSTAGCKIGWEWFIKWPGREHDDNGVSALSLCGTGVTGPTLCYSTWTMSGRPRIIRWGPTQTDTVYELYDDLGTRIQDMAVVPKADFIALINERGDIYQYGVGNASPPALLHVHPGNRKRSSYDFNNRACLEIDEEHNKIIVAYARDRRGYIEMHDIAFSRIQAP